MKKFDNKQLLLRLIKSESENEVEDLLREYGLWDDEKAWRNYGDRENNYGTIGAQQSRPETAMVEKIINSVDSVLTKECLNQGIDPKSDLAPGSIRLAVDKLFDVPQGMLSNLSATERTKLAANIGIVATGKTTKQGNACYSIFDLGEGQTPSMMPKTFLSIGEKNKIDIPFVQGKFNMGSTGVLRFCGQKKMQLILTKRNPATKDQNKSDDSNEWGFTIVRRIPPTGRFRSSRFVYLVKPINDDPGDNPVHSFEADSLDILPGDYPTPYSRPMKYGSYVKLYEYQMIGLKTNLTLDPYNRLSLLMPSLALPVRVYERRKGYKANSAETTLNGLSVRLEEDKRNNLENENWPTSHSITVLGHEMRVKVYAFKKDLESNKKPTQKYVKDEGIIFTVNGQTHGNLSKHFFSRKDVALGKLSDSLLVTVDCSDISGEMREDLFMNSRDRLVDSGELRDNIIQELKTLLGKHEGLKALKHKRHLEEIENKLDDAKPLVEVVQNIMKNSPTLSSLFLPGFRVKNPFNLSKAVEQEEYEGKRFPTFFQLLKEFPKSKPKPCPLDQKTFRVQFKTDVINDYFDRETDRGIHKLYLNDEPYSGNASLNPWNGVVTLNIAVRQEWIDGQVLHFRSEVSDVDHMDPFINEFSIELTKPNNERSKNNKPGNRKPPSESRNDGKQKDSDSLALPNIVTVEKDDPNWIGKSFTDKTALHVEYDGKELGHTFFVNMHNIYLLTEQKQSKNTDPSILAAQFKYANVLIGMSILKADEDGQLSKEEEFNVCDFIRQSTESSSRVLLPLITSLGNLSTEET